jgi:GntR family transcriptional regulator, transcriptional repressor for pyruvate dehydrogenase complex
LSGETPNAFYARLQHVRAHEYVAEQLRREITLRLIHPGDSLPPERELTRMFGVGRLTVQKAIAILVAEGMVEKRRGRSGGTFILDTAADRRGLKDTLARIGQNRLLILDALSFRLEMEPVAVALACRLRTTTDLGKIEYASRQLDDAVTEAQMMKYDTEFHLAVAACTHNRFFEQTAEQIRMALNDVLWILPGSDLWMERTRDEHGVIQRAIEAGDAAKGRRAALSHIGHTDQGIRAILASL